MTQDKLIKLDNLILQKYRDYLLSIHPIFSKIGKRKILHGGGTILEKDDKFLKKELNRIDSSIDFCKKDIYEYNLIEICGNIYILLTLMIDKMSNEIFKRISETCDFTGNYIDNKGVPFNFDQILEMTKIISISFEPDGKPIFPDFFVRNNCISIENIPFNEQQKDKLNEIIIKKREEWNAKKCHRKLSYIQ